MNTITSYQEILEDYQSNVLNKATMSVKELAEEYGISMRKARVLVNQEGFPKVRVGSKDLIIISQVEKWLIENIGKEFNY